MKTDVQILYFSLNPVSVAAFYYYVEQTNSDRRYCFRLFNQEDVSHFKHASDLLFFLESQKDIGTLYIIIDYPSFYSCHPGFEHDDIDETNDTFSSSNAAIIVRQAILGYPEVHFLFDESWLKYKDNDNIKADFTTFLLGAYTDDILKYYHQYSVSVDNDDVFSFVTGKWSNLFDGSRLRYAIKRYILNKLEVRYNFSLLQDSRFNNLALCVEEEHAQNRFNSYALYANGYRVLPICTAKELYAANQKKDKLNPQLIARDYDLQFSDAGSGKNKIKLDDKQYNVNVIDYIRGMKYWDNSTPHNPPSGYKKRIYALYGDGRTVDAKFDYWSKLYSVPTFFITKGVEKLINVKPGKRHFKFIDFDKKSRAYLSGTEKPVSGIYSPFEEYAVINKCYTNFEIRGKFHFWVHHKKRKDDEQNWKIDTKRRNHKHGVPLDIYALVRGMLSKAEGYFHNGKYIRAAITASDAIEILNGFHEALMLRAYHILSISENAIAMNTIGGSDDELKADAVFRIRKIRYEVTRMVYRKGFSLERRELLYNTLNQIYSDCRTFCREKEHFKAEDCFIGAMAHVSDGYTPCDIIRSLIKRLTKLLTKLFRL